MSFVISYLLPLLYIVLLAFLLQRNKYLLSNGLSQPAIIVFFIAKCLAGIMADYISLHFFAGGGDVSLYFSDGLALYETLLKNPSQFLSTLKLMFSISDFGLMNPNSDFIRTVFEGIKFIHFLANLFSFGNVYTNTILFNALTSIAFLRCWVFLKTYTSGWITGAWVFLLPSTFFYTSNILKEGIAFALLAVLIPMAFKVYKHISLRLFALSLLFFSLLFFFKFLVAITFVLALFSWYMLSKFPNAKALVLLSMAALTGAFFFLPGFIHPLLNLPQYLVNRQQAFMALEANSAMPVYVLEPSFIGFVKAFPAAIGNVLFKPLPGEGGKMFYMAHTLEIFFYWGLILWLAFKNRFKMNVSQLPPLFWAMLFFALCNLLIIGYIIPNIGAMVRYRSIFLPWPLVCCWYIFNGSKHLPLLENLVQRLTTK